MGKPQTYGAKVPHRKKHHHLDAHPSSHMLTHMKTTLELPDDLLIEAKAVAARRRTTLKELITRSLRREIGQDHVGPPLPDSFFEVGSLGLPVLKKRQEPSLTPEEYFQKIAAIEEDTLKEYQQRKTP